MRFIYPILFISVVAFGVRLIFTFVSESPFLFATLWAFTSTLGLLYALGRMRDRESPPGVGQDEEYNDKEYHNDFSQVPAATDLEPAKPIDLTGNVFEHNNESFEEDMRRLGIDPRKGRG